MKKSIQHNQEIRNELYKSVAPLSDEQLNQTIEENRWSIMQVMDHLYLMERTITKAIQSTLEKGDKQEVDNKPIHFTVDRSTKVDAPPMVKPSEEFISLAEMKEKLEQSRQELLRFLDGVKEDDLKEKAYPHPIFGMIRLDQWVPFIGYHEKRHLEQIEELKSRL